MTQGRGQAASSPATRTGRQHRRVPACPLQASPHRSHRPLEHGARVPAITAGRAVTLQRASALSPTTNQGQAAALFDRTRHDVLLLLMPSPAHGRDTEQSETGPSAAPRGVFSSVCSGFTFLQLRMRLQHVCRAYF